MRITYLPIFRVRSVSHGTTYGSEPLRDVGQLLSYRRPRTFGLLGPCEMSQDRNAVLPAGDKK